MKRLAFLLAAVVAAEPVTAQADPPRLGLEQAMQLRCSAAFAVVAGEQARGVASAQAYPPLGERGREFFVRAAAGLMDDLGLAREQVQALIEAEVARLQDDATQADDPAAYLDSVMRPCLLALDAAGL